MAEFEKDDFKFPHEAGEAKGKPLETEEEVEYIVEDDTPPEDRNREPLPAEVIKRLEDSDEEHENLDPKAQIARIKAYKKAWNDERRIKDDAMREQKAAFDLAKQVIEENKQLKEQYNAGEKTYIETVQNAADTTLALAIQTALLRRKLLFLKQHINCNRQNNLDPVLYKMKKLRYNYNNYSNNPRLTPKLRLGWMKILGMVPKKPCLVLL